MRVLVFKGKGLETTSNPFFMFVLQKSPKTQGGTAAHIIRFRQKSPKTN